MDHLSVELNSNRLRFTLCKLNLFCKFCRQHIAFNLTIQLYTKQICEGTFNDTFSSRKI